MKASQLPEVTGATHFFVRGANTWGRAPTVAEAIRVAQVRHLQVVHVCRTDSEARAHEVDGTLVCRVRGDIWEGRVWGKDITLKHIVRLNRKGDT